MTRPNLLSRHRARIATIVATLWLLTAPGHALATGPAVDEYSLGQAGTKNLQLKDPQREKAARAGSSRALDTPGVVGETGATQSPLQAAGSSLATLSWIAVATLALIVAVVALRPRARRRTG